MDVACDMEATLVPEAMRGAVGGVKEVHHLSNANREKQAKNEAAKKADSQTRSSPTNLMSVSVPNLPASMEQTASLLDSFAQAARRNLSGGSGSNIVRNANSSLVRLALSNSPIDLGTLLSAAQSYPSLTASTGQTSNTLTTTQTMANVTSLSQALTRSLTSTSSESDNEFLESCRATTLLAELEDDEDLPEPEDDEDENEDENEDDEDYEDVMEEDDLETRDRRTWDDEFVLRRQFSALIPAFDPRPGRTNVNQTQDFEIPAPGGEDNGSGEQREMVTQPRLALSLRAPCLPGMSDEEIPLPDSNACIFKYVQHLLTLGTHTGRNERLRRIWEPTYTIIYKELKDDHQTQPDSKGSKTSSHTHTPAEDKSCLLRQSLLEWGDLPRGGDGVSCTVEHVLNLLQRMFAITMEQATPSKRNDNSEVQLNIPADEFISKKITNKVVQQIQDPLVLASNALPEWCEHLTRWCPMLFPVETRQLYFTCTAFGTSRAIVWLQNKRDASIERNRGPLPRRDDGHEFRVGRLKHERIKVPRGVQLLDWAMQVMKHHGKRKAVLEIEFEGEEGTGLGPTLEFYALVAAELQRKALGLWLSDDDVVDLSEREVDIGHGVRPPGYYVQRIGGLFPAALPQDSSDMDRVEKVFYFLGNLLAKCLQDNRLIDMPMSRPFLKLMCMGEVGHNIAQQYHDLSQKGYGNMLESWHSESSDMITSIEEMEKEMKLDNSRSRQSLSSPWYSGILTEEDFEIVNPHRASFLRQLRDLSAKKQRILKDKSLSEDQKNILLEELALPSPGDPRMAVRLEDLGLTFVFNPSSKVYGFASYDLKPNGENEDVRLDNIEEYIELVTDFCLNTGLRRQMDAFRAGFNLVFPMEKLHSFSPMELGSLLCGEQAPCWNREDIISYTEPKLGYTRESPGFQRLVNVLLGLSADERKAFLQFTTGCSSLPPGGLANLHPRLTVVRKVDGNDSSYPSVNTCVHYLKLPEYSSETILRERLMAATKEKGFHLN